MSIKEFSQKNGVVFFYSTIILLILAVILGFNCFGSKGGKNMGPGNFDRNQKGTMQQNDNSQNDQTNAPVQNNQEQTSDQNQQVQ